jgi:hypothetical protein
MQFLLNLTFWLIVAVCVLWSLWDEAQDKRRIRQLLDETDEMWNNLVNEHQKTIAEAFQRGEPVRFNIDRR